MTCVYKLSETKSHHLNSNFFWKPLHLIKTYISVDLVTKDDLSPEAMLESSQRIDTLGATYRRKAQPLSDPGPPGMLPPKIRKANLFMQIFGLWM